MKRLGPELKMPKLKGGEMKVPPFLSDLYFDLRERRLLPLIALILVAIAATPILLGGGSDEPEPVSPPAAITGGSTPASQTLTVVKAAPGLRNYKKRLGHRSPTNPFKQRFNAPQLNGSELNEPTSTTTTTTTTTGTTGTNAGSATGPPSAPSTDPAGAPTPGGSSTKRLTFFTWAIDAYIHKVPKDPEADDEAITRPRVLAQTPLPGAGNPVVTFMGLSRQAAENDNAPRALFTVSDEVTRVVEGGKCLARGEGACELLEADEGEAITFLYGPGETRYTIKVLKLEPVVTGKS